MLADLKARASEVGHFSDEKAEGTDHDADNSDESTSDAPEHGDAEAVLFEESHITDFWQEVAARHELLKLIETPVKGDDFLGFTKDALLSYLKPVVLVDGQHRLRGAIRAAEFKLDDPAIREEIERRITQGEEPEQIEAAVVQREARRLP